MSRRRYQDSIRRVRVEIAWKTSAINCDLGQQLGELHSVNSYSPVNPMQAAFRERNPALRVQVGYLPKRDCRDEKPILRTRYFDVVKARMHVRESFPDTPSAIQ